MKTCVLPLETKGVKTCVLPLETKGVKTCVLPLETKGGSTKHLKPRLCRCEKKGGELCDRLCVDWFHTQHLRRTDSQQQPFYKVTALGIRSAHHPPLSHTHTHAHTHTVPHINKPAEKRVSYGHPVYAQLVRAEGGPAL